MSKRAFYTLYIVSKGMVTPCFLLSVLFEVAASCKWLREEREKEPRSKSVLELQGRDSMDSQVRAGLARLFQAVVNPVPCLGLLSLEARLRRCLRCPTTCC